MKVLTAGLLMAAMALLSPGLAADPETESLLPAPVGQVGLLALTTVDESAALDVGVAIFDPGIPADASSHGKLGAYRFL